MGLCAPWTDTYLHNWNFEELGMISLKPINVMMITGEITKTGTLAMTFQKNVGGSNPYVCFGYVPLKIFQHILVKVSVSMNSGSIKIIRTSQKSTKEGLNEKLEGSFRSIKSINWIEQVWTPNWHPFHDLPQTCWEWKSVCPVCIRPTDNFLRHPK